MDIKMVPVRDFVIVYNGMSDEIVPCKSGRWIIFSKDADFSATLAKTAVKRDIVHAAKFVKTGAGPVSFYLNVDDEIGHRRVLAWLLGKDLFPEDVNGNIRNQKFIPDAGASMQHPIMLSDYIDLEKKEMRH